RAMDLHREMQASGFADQVAEEVILEVRIFLPARYPAIPILCINGFRDLLWRIAEMERAEVGDFKFDPHAATLFVIFNEPSDKLQIVVKSRWKPLQPFLRQFISQLLFLQGNEDSQIPIARDDGLIVKREEQEIDKKHPAKTFRRKIRPSSTLLATACSIFR